MEWNEQAGYGFLAADTPRTNFFDEYREKDQTPMGQQITELRLALVRNYVDAGASLIDVGIGGGAFLLRCRNGRGLDVDPKAVEWLRARSLLADASVRPEAMCFWDSFEHIEHPDVLVRQYQPSMLAMSIPLFCGKDDVLGSKHYKPGEHLWYFTYQGIVRYLGDLGYLPLHFSRSEELLGREGIGTFVFGMDSAVQRLRCPS